MSLHLFHPPPDLVPSSLAKYSSLPMLASYGDCRNPHDGSRARVQEPSVCLVPREGQAQMSGCVLGDVSNAGFVEKARIKPSAMDLFQDI
jgi:hypothetical protein